MRFKSLTNKGKVRSSNEDNLLIRDEIPFFMVADGMGGHLGGEIASKIAFSVSSKYKFDLSDPIQSLSDLTNKINNEIYQNSDNPENRGMGTTFAAAVIKENKLYYVNLGDSRIYLYNKSENKLKKLSKDHSLVGKLLREGKINEEEAFNHPKKNIVTQALGLEKNLEIDSGVLELGLEDQILLCTDGLSDLLVHKEIKNIFKNNNNLDNISSELLKQALKNGGTDNITLIVAAVDEE